MILFQSYFIKRKTKYSTLFIAMLLGIASCKKQDPTDCYEKAYEDAHKSDPCPAPCDNVIGCDGKTYCNECVMHTHGIKKTK